MTALPLGVSLRQAILAFIAGLFGAAAFWPLSLWPLMLVSVALFLRLLRDQSSQNARNIGLLYGATLASGTMYWMFLIFGVTAVSLLALMAAYFGLLGTLIGLTRDLSIRARIALTALFAVGVEWLRGDAWYLRFPWYTPPHALAEFPASISATRWLGTYGLSYIVWLIAAAGAYGRPRNYAAFVLLPIAWFFLPADGDPAHRAILLQFEEEGADRFITQIPSEKIDLAVLPELAYLVSPAKILEIPNGPAEFARKTDGPVVFGAIEGTYGQMPFSNVAAVIDANGQLLGTFPKQRPVPLMIDGTPGDRQPVFEVKQGVLGVAICYDFDAPAVAAGLVDSGANVLVAPTMDMMEWGVAQHYHHELLSRLRAVENDRWLLRAASSGRSEVISPRGVPSKLGLDIGEAGYIVLPFDFRDTYALGGRLAFLGPVSGVGTLMFIALRVISLFKRRSSGSCKVSQVTSS